MQATGGGIRAPAELAPRVQFGEDQLHPGKATSRLSVHGDPAAVVPDLDGPIGAEDDLDPVADSRQRFVDSVVDDFPQAVHQPALVGGADVHPGAFAHRFKAFENLQVAGRVVPADGGAPQPVAVGDYARARGRAAGGHAGPLCRVCGSRGGGYAVVPPAG